MREKTMAIASGKLSSKVKMLILSAAILFASVAGVALWNQARAAGIFAPTAKFYLNDRYGKNPIAGQIVANDLNDNITIGVAPNSGQTIEKRAVKIFRDGFRQQEVTLTSKSRCVVEKDFSPTDGAERRCSFKLADLSPKDIPDANATSPIDYLILVTVTNNLGESKTLFGYLRFAPTPRTIEFASVDNLNSRFVKKDANGSYKVKFAINFSDNVSRDAGAVKCYLVQKTANGAVALDQKFSFNSVADCENGEFDLKGLDDAHYYLKAITYPDLKVQANSQEFFLDQKNPAADFTLINEFVQNELSVSRANHFADYYDGANTVPKTGCYITKVGETAKLMEQNHFWKNCGVKDTANGPIDLSNFADGEYLLTGWATDLAGNTTETARNFVIDRKKPTGLTLNIDQTQWAEAKITLEATPSTDALSGIDFAQNKTECLIRIWNDGAQPVYGDKVIYRTQDCFANDGATLDLAQLIKDGTIPADANALYIYANAYDKAGNKASTAGQKVLIDRIPPVIQNYEIQNLNDAKFLQRVDGAWTTVFNDQKVNIFDQNTNHSAKAAGCVLEHNGQEIFSAENGVWSNCRDILTTQNLVDGQHDGDYKLTIWAIDYFGNRQEFAQEFKLDTNPPVVNFVLNGVDAANVVDANNFVEIADGANVADANIAEKLCTIAKINDDGSLAPIDGYENVDFVKCGATISDKTKVDVANWPVGNYRVIVTAIDKAGNETSLARNFTIAAKLPETPANPENPEAPVTPSAPTNPANNSQNSPRLTPEILRRNVTASVNSPLFFANTLNNIANSAANAPQSEPDATEVTEEETEDNAASASDFATATSESGEIKGVRDDKTWAVMNLIAAIATALIAVIAAVRKISAKKIGAGITLLAPAIAAAIAFFLTEDWRVRMVWFDGWTLLMVAILAVQIISVAVLAKNSDQE